MSGPRLVLQRIKTAVGDVTVVDPGHAAAHLLRVGVHLAAANARKDASLVVLAALDCGGREEMMLGPDLSET